MTDRTIDQIVAPIPVSDGAGVKILRAMGTPALNYLDPFLMLDVFGSEDGADYIAGFPDHPHRGFETITYMLAGKMRHRDNAGNEGLLQTGGAQWMTAGRGIVHSEMPEQTDGLMKGFQIWINLPAKDKMCAPRYQDINPDQIAVADLGEVGQVKVITGTAFGQTGPVSEIVTQPLFIDVGMNKKQSLTTPVTKGQTAFLYVYEGSIHLDGATIETNRLVTLGDGDQLSVQTLSDDAKFIVLAANSINEPVARHGPFVMNTREEIYQAFEDFHAGKF